MIRRETIGNVTELPVNRRGVADDADAAAGENRRVQKTVGSERDGGVGRACGHLLGEL